MNKKLLNISIKMIIAGIVALFLSYILNVRYYTTASAIAILSIQFTKRDFITIAIKRMISGTLGIIVGALMFYFIGQNFYVFSLFLIIFILASWFLNAPEGIVPTVVIVAHIFLIDKITIAFLLEEVLLLTIAILVAFVVNMLYPQFTFNEMKNNLRKIDLIIEEELCIIVSKLREEKQTMFVDSKKELANIMSNAKMIDRDLIVQNDHRYITYLYMRDMQLQILIDISKNIANIKGSHPYKLKIASYLEKVQSNISFYNQASPLLKELDDLNDYFVNEPLPTTRKEFEIRAILFQVLNDLYSFLNLKIDFHSKYPHFVEEKE